MNTVENELNQRPVGHPSNLVIAILDEHFVRKDVVIPDDDRVTGRQIAEAAGYHSTDEVVVLQQLESGALEEIRPEELVDLRPAGVERFFVIEADVTFRLIIDGLKLEWPRSQVNAATLRRLIGKDEEFDVIHQLDDAPDRILQEDDFVDLSRQGTEHFKTKRTSRLVTVFYGETPFELEKGSYTTEVLASLFHVEAGYVLDLVEDGKFVELKLGQHLQLKSGMHFVSHPPRGQSS